MKSGGPFRLHFGGREEDGTSPFRLGCETRINVEDSLAERNFTRSAEDLLLLQEPPHSQLETCSSTDGGMSRSGSPKHNEIRRLAAPLSKERLIEIIAAAATISPSVKKLVQATALASPAARRIMVRNVHYNTSDAMFMTHFAHFGPLEDAAIVREKCGRSKGFGFVTFKDIDSMRECLNSPLHLDGRKLFVKVAADPFSEFLSDGAPIQGRMTRRKVFVRNLPVNCENAELQDAFQQFGAIEDCAIVSDTRGRSRGFAFITFKSQESAVKAAAEPQQTFAGRVIFVSLAKSGMRAAAPVKSKPNSPRNEDRDLAEHLVRPNVLFEPWTNPSTETLHDLVNCAAFDLSRHSSTNFTNGPSRFFPALEDSSHDSPVVSSSSHCSCLYPYSPAAAAAAYDIITASGPCVGEHYRMRSNLKGCSNAERPPLNKAALLHPK